MSKPLPPAAKDEAELPPSEASSGFDLGEYLGWARRWWKLVAGACLVAMAAGAIHYLIAPRTYRSTATIQIERHTLAQALSSQTPWLESFLDADYYPAAYKQLGSRGLAERVVERLDLLADPAFNPRGSGYVAKAAAPGAAVGDEEVLGNLAERLRKGLRVEPVPRTQLVEISYLDASPAFAKRVANGFADAFIDMGIESRFTSAGKTSTFLESQVEALKEEVTEKEAKLQALSRRTNTVAVDSSPNPTLQRLQALNAADIDATNARLEKEAAYKGLLSAPPETIADSLQPGLIGTMRADVLKLERDYEAKLKIYKPEWPAVAALKSELDRSRQNLAAAVKEAVATARKSAYAAYATALGQERQLEAEIDKLKAQVMDQSSLGAELAVGNRRRSASAGHPRLQRPYPRSRADARPPVLSVAARRPLVRPAARPGGGRGRGDARADPRSRDQESGGGRAGDRPAHAGGHPRRRRGRRGRGGLVAPLLRLRLRQCRRRAACGAAAVAPQRRPPGPRRAAGADRAGRGRQGRHEGAGANRAGAPRAPSRPGL